MARKKRPIALIERALEAFEGRLVSVKSRAVLKVTSGTWDANKQNMTQPEYIVWEPGEIAVFTGLGKAGRSAAGNTRGWAQILLKGRLGYMQPSQLRHLVLEEEVHAPTA
jgi:hypothetical protein